MFSGGTTDIIFIFIVNPNAGNRKIAKNAKKIIHQFLDNTKANHIIEFTKGPGDATKIARKYCEAYGNRCRFVSVGGDGTLNEVLNGMADSGAQLTAIPAGSGNDFVKSVIPEYRKDQILTYDLVYRTLTGESRLIDLATVNGRYFLNIASVGFDADVVYNAISLKKSFIPAKLSYLFAIFISLIKFRTRKMKLSLDGNSHINKEFTLVVIANGKYYGGGFIPVPDAVVDDGILDICMVDKVTRRKVLRFFTKYKIGQHGILKEVNFNKCKSIVIESDSKIRVNIDGELLIFDEARFEINDSKVNFVIPTVH